LRIKDLTKEITLAEQFKQNLDKQRKNDPMKFDLTELLNKLTVNNYNEIANLIYEKIEPQVEYQEKFLDILFSKVINEPNFAFLYAKLCGDLEQKLPQRVKKNEKNDGKRINSVMKSKLLEKCKKNFKIEDELRFDYYITSFDPIEIENKFKTIFLGNVIFIGELVNNSVLSTKIIFQCIEYLFKIFENSKTNEEFKFIKLEAIIILMDKLNNLFQNCESKMNNLDNINIKIDEYIKHLDQIQKEEKIPTYIKFKIINLIERKKDIS